MLAAKGRPYEGAGALGFSASRISLSGVAPVQGDFGRGGYLASVSPALGVRSFVRSYDKNGTGRVTHDSLGNAAEQDTLYATATMAADHDEVRRPVFGSLRDLGGRLARLDELQRRRLQVQSLTETRKQSFAILFGLSEGLSELVSGNVLRGRVDDVDERYVGAE
jgi:hypothetical protein